MMQNQTAAAAAALRAFIAKVAFNLSALLALAAGAVNAPELIMLLMR